MKKKRFAVNIIGICLILLVCGMVDAKEPRPPEVSKTFSPEKEKRISDMERLNVSECFEQLKALDFLLDSDFSDKAAYKCFKNRKAEAIEYAIDQLRQPAYRVNGEAVIPNYDQYVAKTVLKVFATEAEGLLFKAYKEGSAETRANALYVMGPMAGSKAKNLLIEALGDKTVYEETYPGMEGKPLRVCDMAYNQLRLRYADELVDLPRTIANVHRIETRDSYIDEMRSRF